MKKIIANIVYSLAGWKLVVTIPKTEILKSVMIAAPHTSNWDLLYAICAAWKMEIPVKFFIKDSHTKAFYGFFIKALGGIGVDRSKNNNLIELSADKLKASDDLVLMVPAEGTRKRVNEWKKGFYYIALKAEVPVTLAYLDYAKKEAGIRKSIRLSGDFQKDMTEIENYYKDIKGKYPELYNPQIFIRKNE